MVWNECAAFGVESKDALCVIWLEVLNAEKLARQAVESSKGVWMKNMSKCLVTLVGVVWR